MCAQIYLQPIDRDEMSVLREEEVIACDAVYNKVIGSFMAIS